MTVKLNHINEGMGKMSLQVAQKVRLFNNVKILALQKAAEDPYNPLKWKIPGGCLKAGEDLLHHPTHQVKEGVGIEIEIGPPLAMRQPSRDPGHSAKNVVAVSRLCYPPTSWFSFTGNVETDCLTAWKRILLSEIASLDLIPTARDALLGSLNLLQSYLRQWRRPGIRQDSSERGCCDAST